MFELEENIILDLKRIYIYIFGPLREEEEEENVPSASESNILPSDLDITSYQTFICFSFFSVRPLQGALKLRICSAPETRRLNSHAGNDECCRLT